MAVVNEGVKYRISLEDLFSQGINAAERNAMQFESTISGLQNKIAGIFAGYQGFNFAKSVVDTGAGFEAAEVGLSTLLKSADQAHQVFQNIQQDAARTPFDVQSLLLANRSLISAGVSADQAREDVLNLANAIAASGGGADELSRMVVNLQQIKNTGKATGIDIKQFAYAGVNVYGLLADSLGKTTEEVQGMEVSYEMLTAALAKAHAAGGIYEGGLEKMMETTQGQISNLGDLYSMMKNEIFKQQKENIDSVIKSTASLVDWIGKHSNMLIGLVKVVMLGYGAFKAYSIAQSVYATYTAVKVVSALAGVTTAQMGLNMAMSLNPFGLAVAGVTALIGSLTLLSSYYDDIINKQRAFQASVDQGVRDETNKRVDAEILKRTQDRVEQAKAVGKKVDQKAEQQKVIQEMIAQYEKVQINLVGKVKDGQLQVEKTVGMENARTIIADLKKRLSKLETEKKSAPSGSKADESLSEPKASKIQNVTITFNGDFFRNMTNTYATMEQGVDDFMSKLAKALNGVVTDATILARE